MTSRKHSKHLHLTGARRKSLHGALETYLRDLRPWPTSTKWQRALVLLQGSAQHSASNSRAPMKNADSCCNTLISTSTAMPDNTTPVEPQGETSLLQTDLSPSQPNNVPSAPRRAKTVYGTVRPRVVDSPRVPRSFFHSRPNFSQPERHENSSGSLVGAYRRSPEFTGDAAGTRVIGREKTVKPWVELSSTGGEAAPISPSALDI
mmetsp:Transcript_24898/g.62248  ORF Transcript_24898/g.62248 Transcript_24898/m.62248 type:complete len:205 (+) Transcript_24898:1991-2605(+)